MDQYINLLEPPAKAFALHIRQLVHQSVEGVKECIFANHPFFYIPQEGVHSLHQTTTSIMMVFYKDHVNIFASGNEKFIKELKIYKLTKKFTLQIYFDQRLDIETLTKVFIYSLTNH
jgi:hypothetical protein